MDDETRLRIVEGIDKTLVVFAVVAAFAAAPLLRYDDPALLFLTGCWAAIGFGLAFTARQLGTRWKMVTIGVSLGALVVVIPAAVLLAMQAGRASTANDRRCLAIQRDMLSARPRRADAPDLFQALGCRPQGEGSVYALPGQAAATAATRKQARR